MISLVGKRRLTNITSTGQLPRLIQSVPFQKAGPFKLWLACAGSERAEETTDPETAVDA